MNESLEMRLLEQLPIATLIATNHGRVAFWNDSARDLLGWSSDQMHRRSVTTLAAQPSSARMLDGALHRVGEDGTWEGVVDLRRRDDSVVACQVRCSALRNARGERIGAIVALFRAAGDRKSTPLVGRRIAQARREAGLTQHQLADALGVSRRSVQGYESGAVAPYRHLRRLAEVLGRPSEWFVADGVEDPAASRRTNPLLSELRTIVRDELGDFVGELRARESERSGDAVKVA